MGQVNDPCQIFCGDVSTKMSNLSRRYLPTQCLVLTITSNKLKRDDVSVPNLPIVTFKKLTNSHDEYTRLGSVNFVNSVFISFQLFELIISA